LAKPVTHIGQLSDRLRRGREKIKTIDFAGLVADGDSLPAAKDIDAPIANLDHLGEAWAAVEFDVTPYSGKAARFNATLPDFHASGSTLGSEAIGATARSGFLAAAALRELPESP
jgi:hypothetical protein